MSIKCECGGELKIEKLDQFDFSPLAGLPVKLVGVPGFRCGGCERTTLPGTIINSVMRRLPTLIVRQPFRLHADQARFLRKCLRLTQQELADRMGIARETVADWERGKNVVSAQHDLNLRALVVSDLARTRKKPLSAKTLVDALGRTRTAEPQVRREELVIDHFLRKHRDALPSCA